MSKPRSVFFAYPGAPAELKRTIDQACAVANEAGEALVFPWPQLPIFGAAIPAEIRDKIDAADVLFCDVTFENYNVYYEIGYAIGRGKPIAPVVNVGFEGAAKDLQADGLFDIIGYKTYENIDTLRNLLRNPPTQKLTELYAAAYNSSQPLYILDTQHKLEFRNAIVSAVKSSGVFFRSFDPVEIPRFSTIAAIGEATSSAGIVIPFLNSYHQGNHRHNLRAAFLAGLGHGLGRETLLIQLQSGNAAPADYREMVQAVAAEDQVTDIVKEFADRAMKASQGLKSPKATRSRTKLQRLTLGGIAAENEFRTLDDYFVETSEFVRTRRGDVNIVAGRKGSGKTAIFFMVRDEFRSRRTSHVTDLKPESHQLSLFRESLMSVAGVGLFDHTLAAFWYYVILSEIALTIKRNLSRVKRYGNMPSIFEIENELDRLHIKESGDFTSRITRLSTNIIQEIERIKSKGENLSAERVTNMIFKSGVVAIREIIVKFTDRNSDLIFLFDNIDKGWPSNGIHDFDVRMVRLLLESLEKVKNDFHAHDRDFVSVVFLRNDIYEMLVDATPDRGKSAEAKIDWTDRIKLRQVIYRRLQYSTKDSSATFEQLWGMHFVKSVRGVNSFEYCVDHCLMRPRFLINIIENAVSHAINRGHDIVQEVDFEDAVLQHAHYLVNEFGYEMRDVSGLPAEILFSLVGATEMLTKDEVLDRFSTAGVDESRRDEAFRLLLWYGVLGVGLDDGKAKFIYDYEYSLKRLEAQIRALGEDALYVANKAVHIALAA